MPWQPPPLCVVAYWSLITHVVYLAHVAATEHYSDQSKCVFKYFNVRYDFTSVHPLLLEWIHTFETAFVIGLAAHACGGRAAAPPWRKAAIRQSIRDSISQKGAGCISRLIWQFCPACAIIHQHRAGQCLEVTVRQAGIFPPTLSRAVLK